MGFNLDPILFTDPDTGATIAGGLEGDCSVLWRTRDDGASWSPLGNTCASPAFDHETIATGPVPAAFAGIPGARAAYYCAQVSAIECSTSIDGGMTFGDGLDVGDIQDVILRDRQKLSRDGTFIVVAPVREQDGSVVSGPDITAKGFVYMGNRRQLMKEVSTLVKKTMNESASLAMTDPGLLQEHIHNRLAKFLFKKTKKRPLIMVIVVEV